MTTPYRAPGERDDYPEERGPRWGATKWVRLVLRLQRLQDTVLGWPAQHHIQQLRQQQAALNRARVAHIRILKQLQEDADAQVEQISQIQEVIARFRTR